MKKEFAITDNVRRFAAAVDSVIKAPPGIDRMVLVYGDPGLGKTETALWWWNRHAGAGAAYIRTKKLMNGRWLLGEIIAELGETPVFKTEDRFRQAQELLLNTDRVVILDEVDYLTHDARIIETVRDLHDICGNPFVFIGMQAADKKLRRYQHLWRRFSQVIRFEFLSKKDVESVMNQICETPIKTDVIDHIMRHHQNRVTSAMIYRWAQAVEVAARRAGADMVDAKLLAG